MNVTVIGTGNMARAGGGGRGHGVPGESVEAPRGLGLHGARALEQLAEREVREIADREEVGRPERDG